MTNKEFHIKSLFGGMYISITSIAYLMTPNPLIGSVLFSLGLFAILGTGCNLFTGYVGYLGVQKTKDDFLLYAKRSLFVWLFNFIGAIITSQIVRQTVVYDLIEMKLDSLVTNKLCLNPFEMILLGVMCGILMYTAIDTFKYSYNSDITKTIVVVLCVVVFLTCKFEHCVANMAYVGFGISQENIPRSMLLMLCTSIGNTIGCCLVPRFLHYKFR